jgi:hypothetical protein
MVRNSLNREVLSIFWRSAENARAEIVRQLAEIGDRLSSLEEHANSDDLAAQARNLRSHRETLIARLASQSTVHNPQPL